MTATASKKPRAPRAPVPGAEPPPDVAGTDTNTDSENTDADVLAVMFPCAGLVLDLDEHGNHQVEIDVLPLGFRHLRTFSDKITTALGIVGSMSLPAGQSPEQLGKAIMMRAAPLLMGDLFELLRECVVITKPVTVKLDDLPHWLVPKIVTTWLELSFGDPKKWRPWIGAIDQAMTSLTRQPFSILATVQQAVSRPDTPGEK